MPPAYVQSTGAAGTAANPTKAFTTNNTAGNLLVACWRSGGTLATTSITDSQGNTWVRGLDVPSATDISFWYALNCKAGANTVTLNQSNTFYQLVIAEYSGVATANLAIDVYGVSTAASGTSVASQTLTTTNANDLLLCAVMVAATGKTLTGLNESWINRQGDGGGTTALCEQVVSSTGAHQLTCSFTGSAAWYTIFIAFRDTAATGIVSVQGTYKVTSSSATQSVIFDSQVFAGDLLVAICCATPGANTITSVADTAGNTWIPGPTFTDSTQSYFLYYVPNCAANANNFYNTVTFNWSGSVTGAVAIAEYMGIATSSPIDQTGTAATGSGTAVTTNSIVTTAANELILAWVGNRTSGDTVLTAGTGFTLRATTGIPIAGPGGRVFIEDKVVSSIGTYSATATFGGSVNWGASILSFLGAVTGHAISGTIVDGSSTPVAGVTVACTGQSNATTDGSGNYSFATVPDGAVTVTPTKTGWTFSPANHAETMAGADITGVNFTGTNTLVATPSISIDPGTGDATVTDTDSALTGFAMYYTTDGSTPTTGSTAYTVPVTLTLGQTIKVLAVATSYADSAIASATYSLGSGGQVGAFLVGI